MALRVVGFILQVASLVLPTTSLHRVPEVPQLILDGLLFGLRLLLVARAPASTVALALKVAAQLVELAQIL